MIAEKGPSSGGLNSGPQAHQLPCANHYCALRGVREELMVRCVSKQTLFLSHNVIETVIEGIFVIVYDSLIDST